LGYLLNTDFVSMPLERGLNNYYSKIRENRIMAKITDELYERFQQNIASMSGDCVRTTKQDLGKTIADIFAKAGIADACVAESPLLLEGGVTAALQANGLQVYTDHIRLHAETAKGGVSEVQYGIADLGTLVQASTDVDCRIVATASEHYVGIVKGSTIVGDIDDMFDVLCALPELPNFVGFMTGPSRTADIECVTTVGVHGPLKLTAVVVDDE